MLEATIIHTAISAVQAICTWIEQLHAKQQKIIQLGQTVQALSLVLEPLQDHIPNMDLDKSVVILLHDLLGILNGVKGHLSLWGGKSKKSKFVSVLGFLSPSIALGMLSDDEQRLSQWISIFMLSLQVSMLRKQLNAQPAPAVSRSVDIISCDSSVSGKTAVDYNGWTPLNDDVSSFWAKNVGEEKILLSSSKFIAALEVWTGQSLDETLRNEILLELDGDDIGSITRKTLQHFAGKRTLRECIDNLRSQSYGLNTSPRSSSPNHQHVNLEPTLVWVDDEIDNIRSGLEYAVALGVRVIQLPSTIATKLWVEQNEVELRTLEKHGLVQFITDNARWEVVQCNEGRNTSSPQSLNMSAGESILRYLRGHGYKAPVLVYCGQSILLTQYVMAYSRAASTEYQAVTRTFIDRLTAVDAALQNSVHSGGRVGADNMKEEDERFWLNYGEHRGFRLTPGGVYE